MGAEKFSEAAHGQTAAEAFSHCREQALHDYGHRGYTGTIAEKHDFVMLTPPAGVEPSLYARALLDGRWNGLGKPQPPQFEQDRKLVDDKWGPAGCLDLGPAPEGGREFLFFGWASS